MLKRIIIIFALTVAVSSLYAANLFLDPGFESLAIFPSTFKQLGSGDTTNLPGWTVTGATCGLNCVLVLTSSYTESNAAIGTITFQAHGGNQSLDLTGGGNTVDGEVQQTVTLAPGTNYTMSFWIGNMDNNASSYGSPSAAQLLINGVSQGTFTNNNNSSHQLNWQQFSVSFTPNTASNTFQFRNATDINDQELGLDDAFIDVTPTAAVPEPTTFGLLASALGVLGFSARKRATMKFE